MTEKDALNKWCPMAETGVHFLIKKGKIVDVREAKSGDHPWCVGSACMAWRWNTKYTSPPESFMQTYPRPEGITEVSKTEGYCGLAGKP